MYECARMYAHTFQNLNFCNFFLSRLIPTSSDGILLSLLKDLIMQIFRLGLLNIHKQFTSLSQIMSPRGLETH